MCVGVSALVGHTMMTNWCWLREDARCQSDVDSHTCKAARVCLHVAVVTRALVCSVFWFPPCVRLIRGRWATLSPSVHSQTTSLANAYALSCYEFVHTHCRGAQTEILFLKILTVACLCHPLNPDQRLCISTKPHTRLMEYCFARV